MSTQHTHELLLKPRQSSQLSQTHIDVNNKYSVGTLCRKCRKHITVDLEFPEGASTPCGRNNKLALLHHFRYQKHKSSARDLSEAQGSEGLEDRTVFTCTSASCSAQVTFTCRPPMLQSSDVDLLSDRSLFKERLKKARDHNPEWIIDEERSPSEALSILYQYFNNALNGKGDRIPRQNRRYMECLGSDLDKVFLKVHFKPYKKPDEVQRLPNLKRDFCLLKFIHSNSNCTGYHHLSPMKSLVTWITLSVKSRLYL